MTYLQIVNKILRHLREDEVSSVQDNDYSKQIGDLVNSVKDEVEGAWQWNVLRDTITVNTIASTFRYVLTDAGTKSILLDAYNDTQNCTLEPVNMSYMNRQHIIGTPVTGAPSQYGINGSDANGDLQVDVYPIPDGVYNLDFNLILKQADLAANSDTPLVPSDVIVLGAWALAVSERGEDGGQSYNEIDARYRNSLADAISIDASNMHTSETKWYAL